MYHLPDPLPGETVLQVIHRDSFIALKRIFLFIVLLALPVGLFFMLSQLFPDLHNGLLAWPIIVLSASGYLFFVWLLFFFSIIDYILDVWVVTNERIINIEQNGFFSRTIAEQHLSKIQDVSSDVHGFWPTIWKYGNVTVQTAGEFGKFHMEEVPNPDRIRDMLVKMSSQFEQREREERAGAAPVIPPTPSVLA